MNVKINTICFCLLLFLFIGIVNASDNNTETLQVNDENVLEKIAVNLTSDDVKLTSTSKKTVTTTSKVKVNLKASNVKMHYKDGSTFKITLKDNNKKVMKSCKVKIEINGQTYNKVTDSKGKASINLNFKSGTYNVITTYAGSNKYLKQSIKNTVTIKSTIKASDFTKFYTNNGAFTSKFYDKKGKLLKESNVKFKLNSKTYTVKTSKYGIGKLNVDLKPGFYNITIINSKTSESIVKNITIKSIVESHNLSMSVGDGSVFSVKILNSYGKASPNKKVSINVYGNTYTPKTNQNGIASIKLNLKPGTYPITTEYAGLKYVNYVVVKKANVEVIKKSEFTHSVLIPSYVNVTSDYVFHNAGYAIKTGVDGIIKIPKNDLFTIQIANFTSYLFSNAKISNISTKIIGYQYHLIPFNGSPIQSDFKKENLKGDGIIISKSENYTQIEYRKSILNESELFTTVLNNNSINYLENNNICVKISYLTCKYDESGLKYNLAKFYNNYIDDYNDRSYWELTNNNLNVRYVNTNESIVLNNDGKSIVKSNADENIITDFTVSNGEFEKVENSDGTVYRLLKS